MTTLFLVGFALGSLLGMTITLLVDEYQRRKRAMQTLRLIRGGADVSEEWLRHQAYEKDGDTA